MRIRNRLIVGALAVLIGSGSTSEAAANAVFGDFLGVFEGNNSESSILLDLGLEVIRLERVETRFRVHSRRPRMRFPRFPGLRSRP